MSRVLVVSPVRNEAAHIERVARALAAQTRPPERWVAVDDGSSDETFGRLEALRHEIPFLTLIRSPGPGPNGGDPLASAREARAFNAGLAAAGGPGEYTHVAKLDGDVELPREALEHVLAAFEREPKLGMAGCQLVERSPRGGRHLPVPGDHVFGGARVYSVECLEAVGGVEERLGWDTIDQTYARMKGFLTLNLTDVEAVHHREFGSAGGRLRGRARHGRCAYVVRQGLPWAALRSAKVAVRGRPPVLAGLAFLTGYLRAALARVDRVDDPSFRRFVHRDQTQRLVRPLHSR